VSLAISLHFHVIEKICIFFDDLLFIKCARNISNKIFDVPSKGAFGCKVILQFFRNTMVSEKTLVLNTLGCLDEKIL